MFVELADEISDTVADLFNKSLISGKVPPGWKLANVTPIFNKNSSGDELANVNFFYDDNIHVERQHTCRGQRLRPLNRLANFYFLL